MNSSATVVTKLSGKLYPVDVNQLGSQVPEARCGPPRAKTRVHTTTRTNQNAILVGLPIASETQFATLKNASGGFSVEVSEFGLLVGLDVLTTASVLVIRLSNPHRANRPRQRTRIS